MGIKKSIVQELVSKSRYWCKKFLPFAPCTCMKTETKVATFPLRQEQQV